MAELSRWEHARLLSKVADLRYRILARKITGSIDDDPPVVVVAAAVCKRTRVQPSEFKAMSIFEKIELLTSLVPSKDDKKAAKPPKKTGRVPRHQPRTTVNTAMYELLVKYPAESIQWTADEYAEKTGYHRSTILNSKTWKDIVKVRASSKEDRKSRTPKKFRE